MPNVCFKRYTEEDLYGESFEITQSDLWKIPLAVIALVALSSAALLSLSSISGLAQQQANLIQNGDFQLPLVGHWNIVKVRELGKFPDVGRSDEHTRRNYYLYMNTPLSTLGYVESREFFLPKTGKALLNFKVWNENAPVNANVTLVNSVGNESVVARFSYFSIHRMAKPNEVPTTRSVDITRFSGQNLRLRIWSTSNWDSGAIIFFDDIEVEAVRERQSVITVDAIPLGTSCSPALRFPVPVGASIAIVGNVYPAPSNPTPVKLQAIRPDGRIPSLKVAADSTGYFEYIFATDVPGVWGVSASWPGDSDHDADESYIVYFPVGSSPKLEIVTGTLNGRTLDTSDPEIEVKTNEPIEGEISIRSNERCRNANTPIVAFNSWERDKWNLLLYATGAVSGDPMGTKTYFAAPAFTFKFAGFNYKIGSFSINYTWIVTSLNSSVPNDVTGASTYPNPTYRAPSKEGVYYIGLAQGPANYARGLLYDIAPLGTFVSSIWEADSRTWEAFIPKNRDENTRFRTLTIRIKVIDVDATINNANRALEIASKNNWDAGEATAHYKEALREHNSNNYGAAKLLAEKAYSIVGPIVETRISEVRIIVAAARELMSRHEANIDTSRLAPDLNTMDEQFNLGNFERAKLIAEDIQRKINNELLLRNQSLKKREQLTSLMWEAQVTSRERTEIESSFRAFLNLFENRAYGASLERATYVESKVVSDRIYYVTILGLSFLAGGVPSIIMGRKLEDMSLRFIDKRFKKLLPPFLKRNSVATVFILLISLPVLFDSVFSLTGYSAIGTALVLVSVSLGWLLAGKRRDLLQTSNKS